MIEEVKKFAKDNNLKVFGVADSDNYKINMISLGYFAKKHAEYLICENCRREEKSYKVEGGKKEGISSDNITDILEYLKTEIMSMDKILTYLKEKGFEKHPFSKDPYELVGNTKSGTEMFVHVKRWKDKEITVNIDLFGDWYDKDVSYLDAEGSSSEEKMIEYINQFIEEKQPKELDGIIEYLIHRKVKELTTINTSLYNHVRFAYEGKKSTMYGIVKVANRDKFNLILVVVHRKLRVSIEFDFLQEEGVKELDKILKLVSPFQD